MSKLTELALASYEFEKQAQDTTGKKVARGAGIVGGGIVGGHIGSNLGGLAGALVGGAISRRPLDGALTGALTGGIAGGVAGLVGGAKLGHRAVKSMQKEAKAMGFSDITPVPKGTGTVIENGSTMPVKTPLATRPSHGMATGLEGAAKAGMSTKMKLGLAGGALALGAGAMALMHKKKQDDGQVKAAADYSWKDLGKATAGTVGGAAVGGAVGTLIAGPVGAAYGVVSGAARGYHHWGKGMYANGQARKTHSEAETYTAPAAVGRAAGLTVGAVAGGGMGKHLGRFAAMALSKKPHAGSYGYVAGAGLGALAGAMTTNSMMNKHVKKAGVDKGMAKEEKDDTGPFNVAAGAEADKADDKASKGKSMLIAAAEKQMAKPC